MPDVDLMGHSEYAVTLDAPDYTASFRAVNVQIDTSCPDQIQAPMVLSSPCVAPPPIDILSKNGNTKPWGNWHQTSRRKRCVSTYITAAFRQLSMGKDADHDAPEGYITFE